MASTRSLETYRSKRDFAATPEPAGDAAAADRRRFVVQKHAARRLHFDFRLEWGGVLLSWAVTRGPSADPGAKRLAVRTEDHPVDYAAFEGVIPAAQYGGGTVMLWDQGTWTPVGDVDAGLAEGKLKFVLDGARMRGGWTLVRMKPRKGERGENWLLIKEDDAEAAEGAEGLVDAHTTSVTSGRSMDEIAGGAPAKAAKRARKAKPAPLPTFRPPQLARLEDAPPAGDGWLHEVKYDGYRCLAAVAGGGVRLSTRTGLDWTDRFRVLVPDFAALPCRSAAIDGEVIAPGDASGAFSELQARLGNGGALLFMAFDLLELDGADLAGRPLVERKARLEQLLGAGRGAINYSAHVTGRGAEVFAHLCEAGQEGVVSKRADEAYHAGRHASWIKAKCGQRQEFVIGGWSPSAARGRPFASLLMGTFEDGALRYRGRVGTGFGAREFAELAPRLAALEQDASPFAAVPPEARRARWVRPELAAEIAFTGLTGEGAIRHGVYMGLREDKAVGDIQLEGGSEDKAGGRPTRGKAAAAKVETPAPEAAVEKARRAKPVPTKAAGAKAAAEKAAGKKASGGKASGAEAGRSSAVKAAAAGAAKAPVVKGQRISSPERRVYESPAVTKLEVAEHYAAFAERILAFAGKRPVSLLRCPDGVAGECFFQKHRTPGMPEAVGTVRVPEVKGGEADYIMLSTAASLVGAAQMGAIEIHMWGSRHDRLETPDRLVFDLDPDEGLGFARVRAAAVELRDRLADLGLPSVPMLTGGKGVHVIVPMRPAAGWDTVKLFARAFAQTLATDAPKRYTATMAKKDRTGRIFVDWLRNERGSTAVAPYSLRARPGAKVAVPVGWDELARIRTAGAFDIRSVRDRLAFPCPLREAGKRPPSLGAAVIARLERAAGG